MTCISPRLIAINGLSGSGKSLVSERLRDRHGFEHASSGLLCRKITTLLFGHDERSALNQVSQAMRAIDQHIWIKATLRDTKGDCIVFDSVRYLEDAHFLKSKGFEIWKVYCPVEMCMERLQKRGQVFNPSDFQHDSERTIPDELCRAIVRNDGCTLQDVCAQVDKLLAMK